MGLIDNNLSLVLAHPVQRMANETLLHMLRDLRSGAGPTKRLIGFEIYTPENV